MKNKSILLLMACAVVFLISSCKDTETIVETMHVLSFSEEKVELSASASKFEIEVSSSEVWTIASSQQWCVISHPKTSNEPCLGEVVTISLYENYTTESREATVTITSANGVKKNLKVKQSAFHDVIPQITSFEFKANKCSDVLISDITCNITDNVISVLIPYITENKSLVADFSFEGQSVFYNELEFISGETRIDYSSPVEIIVRNKVGEERKYTVEVSAFTGLPVMYINTANNAAIVSKENYLTAKFKLVEDLHTRSSKVLESEVQIRGRGNSTWGMVKKPYKLKFDKKTSLLGEPKHKHWVLLANYSDKTSLRVETAFGLSRMSDLAWTPRAHFVEVILNERYIGTYQLCEQIKIDENRVNVTDNGFLLEIDQLSRMGPDDVYFQTNRILVNIKGPDVVKNSTQYNWIKKYVTDTENTLFGANFKDTELGYAKYMDIPSFVDWYLINEIAKNSDAAFLSSCYMNIAPEGKLKMGPAWDFDIAFGNINYGANYPPEGFWIKNSSWYKKLFEDPAFVEQVKIRFQYFKSRKDELYNEINANATYLQWSVIENNNKWGTLYNPTWPNHAIWGSYQNEVQYMKKWLNQRFDWLDQAFSQL